MVLVGCGSLKSARSSPVWIYEFLLGAKFLNPGEADQIRIGRLLYYIQILINSIFR